MNSDTLFKQFDFQRQYLSLLVDDIAENQMTSQPGPVINHPAWHIGHLAWALNNAVELAGGRKKALGEAWDKLFAAGTIPVADRAGYPSKAELLKTFDERRKALVAQCGRVSDADWDKPNPVERLRQSLPTVWDFMHFLLLTHESTHLGQLATWRRAQGLPMALSKLQPRNELQPA